MRGSLGINQQLTIFQPENKLQAGPDVVHGADFYIHEPVLQADFASNVFIHVCLDAGSAFGPGDPERACRSQMLLQFGESAFQFFPVLSKELNEVACALQRPGQNSFVRQWAQRAGIIFRAVGDVDLLSTLYAQLVDERSFGVSSHGTIW